MTKAQQRPTDSRHRRGARAEAISERHLVAHGCEVVARNYSCRLGEIDLIVRDQRHLIFVEVRYRCGSAMGSAAETVTAVKQRRIINAARHFLQHQPKWRNAWMRFDVIGVDGQARGEPTLTWIKNAFDASSLG